MRAPPAAATIGHAVHSASMLGDDDIHLFNEGSHLGLHEKLGSHAGMVAGRAGYFFAVWAPDARRVSVIGDFNGWNAGAHEMRATGSSGIWEAFIPGVTRGTIYKYRIESRHGGHVGEKADPFAIHAELPPRTGSIAWSLEGHDWADGEWMRTRARRNALDAPMSVYEMHVGSWRRVPEEGDRPLTYRELAAPLAEHCRKLGFTHVEFMPIMEHPFGGSWGYQVTGFFAPTSRYGTPQDFKYLVDQLHQAGIGVVLDWVPSHFPADAHGIGFFDGTHLYEHSDPRQGLHPDWGSSIFNFGRREVCSFLLSSAMYWLEEYHADALRVDAVASMLYLDYSRKAGEWIPNVHGGRENLEAIAFLRRLNEAVYARLPDVQIIAEESTAWPMVSRPTFLGGLGFGLKWDMGWMHDTLAYLSEDPVHRRFHHDRITFRSIYADHENFMLPLSHDEVVHGKGSLLGKMPGDEWRRFANLRLLLACQHAQPGKKLLFMGGELGQIREWSNERSLDWDLLERAPHRGIACLVADLNRLHRDLPALHERDCDRGGFEWVDGGDAPASVVSFLRRGRSDADTVLVVLNFTPVVRHGYRVGVPSAGSWIEALNTDATCYGGSNVGNLGGATAAAIPHHGRRWSVELTLPPLAAVFLRAPAIEGAA